LHNRRLAAEAVEVVDEAGPEAAPEAEVRPRPLLLPIPVSNALTARKYLSFRKLHFART
jgi:hypothetical protein